MPRESSGRTRQSASRNTPSPHSTSQDSIFGLLPSGSKARKTRNSAEASLLYSIMDLSAIGRRRSRRGKAAVASDVENQDTESSCSNIGEENSQDGLPSFSSALVSNNPHKQDCGDAGDGNKSDKLNSAVPVKSEFDSIYSNSSPVSVKEEPGDGGSHCDNSSLTSNTEFVATSHSRNARDSSSRSPQIRTEQNGAAEHDVTKTPVDLPTDDKKEVKKESLSCDKSTESSDEQKPSILTVQVSSASESTQRDVAHLDPGSGCDGVFTQKSSGENSKIDSEAPQPTSAHFSSTQDSNSKADDSGFVSVGCAKDSDEDACSDNQNGSSEDVKASVQAALIDHAAYSAATVKSKAAKSRVKEEIIMEESDEEEEEMEPDLEEFELIADSVKGLQDIVNQFADPVPPAADSGSSRKGKKQRVWKPPQRKRCEVELRQRLTSMLNELTKWEQKLVQAAARMRTKMRREFDEYKEELPKEEDTEAWDTEPEADSSDEEGNEDSQTGEDGEESEESQTGALLAAAKKKKGPSSTPSTASETTEVDRRDVEDYEMDVSSRGRLRKRRVIPNNIEDQGIKKKKVTKKPDGNETPVTTAHMPNILQKSQPGKQVAYSYTFSPSGLGDSSALLASLTRQGGTGVLSLSASQLLAMAVSQGPAAAGSTTVTGTVKGQQQQGLVLTPQGLVLKTTQASSQVSAPGAGSTGQPSSGSAKLNSHPEIQKLLSARRPLVVDSRHAPYKTVQLRETGSTGAQKGLAAAAVSTNPTASPSSSVPSAAVAVGQAHQPPGAKGAGTTTTGAGATSSAQRSGTMMLAMVGGKPQLVPASLVQQLMKAGTLRIQATTTAAAAGVTNSAPISSQSGTIHPAGIAIRPANRPQGTPQVAATQVAQTVRPGTVTQSLNRMQLNSLVLKPATPGQVTSLGQVVPPARIQGVAGVVGGVGGVAVTSSGLTVSPTSLAQVAVLGSPGKQLQRYAGNVTVKTLLENRAARKSSEDGESSQTVEGVPQSTTPSSPPKNSDVPSLSITNSPPASRTTLGVVPTAGLMARGVGVPGVVRLSSQSMLDLAVQTVVTSYHTTLPTADIKVPSPTTLPSLSPKKNVTSVVMSTKAPIPITTRCESTSSSSALTKSAGLAAVAGGASLTAVVQGSDAAKPGVVLMTGGKDLDPNNKNKVVLQVVPQGGVGSQTIVQGVMLSDGIVIPQGALPQTLQLQTAARATQHAATPGTVEMQSPISQKPQALAATSPPAPCLPAQPLRGQQAGKAATNKATTDVLKSMLAAKAGTSVPTTQQPMSSPTAAAAAPPSPTASVDQNAAAVIRGRVKVGASMPAAALVQQMAAIRGVQNPRIIGTQVAGAQQRAAAQVQVPLGQLGKVVAGQVQLQGGSGVFAPQQQLVQQQQQQAVSSSTAGRVVMASSPAGAPVANHATVSLQGQPTQQTAQSGAEQMMTMTLPPGLQLAAMPGSTALQLVSPAQMSAGVVGGAGGGQPIVAAVRGGPQGLQQLRLLAAPGGTQKIHVLTPQQQQALAVKQLATAALGQGTVTGQVLTGQPASVTGGKSAGTVMGDASAQLKALTGISQGQQHQPQQQQVQLCFKVQPSGQVLASATPATTVAAGVPQGRLLQTNAAVPRPVLPRPQVNHSALSLAPSTSNPSAAAGPVVSNVASPSPSTLTANNQPGGVVLQPASKANFPGKGAGQQTVQVPGVHTNVTGKTALVGRLQMTITPDPSTGQLTISPQPAPPLPEASKGQSKDGSQTMLSPPQLTVSGNMVTDGQQKQDQVSSPKGKADVGYVGAKRSSDTSVQPIPVKMARWDAPSNLSGPVLASLSQVVGAKMNKNPGHVKGNGVAKTVPNSIANSALGQLGGLSETDSQPAVMTQAEDQDPQNNVEAGFTSLGSVSTGSVVTDAAGTVSPNHTGHTIQAQINVAQWLQQMQQTSAASVVTTSAQPTVQQIQGTDQQQLLQQLQQQQQHQQQQQQQQPVVMMRTVGGQLLTPLNIPVTVNNGVMKVLPKATFQVGNQMVTVLSPSNAMIQNLKSPTQTQSNSVGVSGGKAAVSASQHQQLIQGELVTDSMDDTGQSNHASDAGKMLSVAATTTQPLVSQPVTVSATSQVASKLCASDKGSVVASRSSAILGQAVTDMTGGGPTAGTPVLKARLQQPVNAGSVAVPSPASLSPLINGAGGERTETTGKNASTVVSQESGDAFTHNGNTVHTGDGNDGVASGGPDNLIEKEQAALSLLTFANQVPTD